MKLLKDSGILAIEKRGLPAKNYYDINDDKIQEILNRYLSECENQPTSEQESTKQVGRNHSDQLAGNLLTSEQETYSIREDNIKSNNIKNNKIESNKDINISIEEKEDFLIKKGLYSRSYKVPSIHKDRYEFISNIYQSYYTNERS